MHEVTSEISYRLLIEGIVDVAIYMLEIDGTIASWNVAAQRIKRYDAAEIGEPATNRRASSPLPAPLHRTLAVRRPRA